MWLLWLFIGFVVGFLAGFLLVVWGQYHKEKDAVNSGFIKLLSKVYMIKEIDL